MCDDVYGSPAAHSLDATWIRFVLHYAPDHISRQIAVGESFVEFSSPISNPCHHLLHHLVLRLLLLLLLLCRIPSKAKAIYLGSAGRVKLLPSTQLCAQKSVSQEQVLDLDVNSGAKPLTL
ncbi:hypothetical protein ACLKA6_015402 [Drosophila palustris]